MGPKNVRSKNVCKLPFHVWFCLKSQCWMVVLQNPITRVRFAPWNSASASGFPRVRKEVAPVPFSWTHASARFESKNTKYFGSVLSFPKFSRIPASFHAKFTKQNRFPASKPLIFKKTNTISIDICCVPQYSVHLFGVPVWSLSCPNPVPFSPFVAVKSTLKALSEHSETLVWRTSKSSRALTIHFSNLCVTFTER